MLEPWLSTSVEYKWLSWLDNCICRYLVYVVALSIVRIPQLMTFASQRCCVLGRDRDRIHSEQYNHAEKILILLQVYHRCVKSG